MKTLILSLVLGFAGLPLCRANVAATAPARNPPNWGQRKPVAYQALRKEFESPDMI